MKIVVVASLAFGLLAACYAAGCRCYERKITTVPKTIPLLPYLIPSLRLPLTKTELKKLTLYIKKKRKPRMLKLLSVGDSDDDSYPLYFLK